MLREIINQTKIALLLLTVMMVLTGVIYSLFVTGLSQLFFPWQANGSIIRLNNQAIGSALIGQYFNDPQYFWGRPSATSPFQYNAENSSGSNLSLTNPDFLAAVKQRIDTLKISAHNDQLIPVDLVTASASGLDPEISPLAALYQIPRIALSRHVSETVLRSLIQNHLKPRTFFLLGEPRVNVLELNLALDQLGSVNDKSAS